MDLKEKIATVDIEDTIVVDTGDALLISKKGSSQKVKKVVAEVRQNSELHNIHLTAHRPWGTYTVLEESEGYKIKRIEVKPGKRLSLQKHYHRNEHWIVVSGTATVTVGETKQYVRPNESTYIKMGELHRLENEGKIPVVLIEALALPVSCNTVIEKSNSFKEVKRTKIGSPYVIETFEELKTSGTGDLSPAFKSIAGFEANGGFLLGSHLQQDNNTLYALPTRDALLPFIVLASFTVKEETSLSKLVNKLPQRFTSSDRIQEFPRENSMKLIEKGISNPRELLENIGLKDLKIVDINQVDGMRMIFDNEVVVHLRPSGNAPELRYYVETYNQELADELVVKVLSNIKYIKI